MNSTSSSSIDIGNFVCNELEQPAHLEKSLEDALDDIFGQVINMDDMTPTPPKLTSQRRMAKPNADPRQAKI